MVPILLALLGGLVALDSVSAVQAMISRPIVAGVVAGTILGQPALGLQVGAVLELFLLVAVPAGGGRFPEGGTAAVVGVAAAAWSPVAGGALLGLATGLVWGQVGGWSQARLRIWNGRHVPDAATPVSSRALARSVGFGLGADFLRGVGVTGLGLALVRVLGALLAPGWDPVGIPPHWILLPGALVSVGVLLRAGERTRRRLALFAAGIVLGVLAGVGSA